MAESAEGGAMLRWGVLGGARIATAYVIPAIQASRNGNVTALASRDGEKARRIAAHFGIAERFESYEALLQSDTVDAVYIPLPTSRHAEWTQRAVDAGKHVLCEKPIGMAAGEIERLLAARDASGRMVAEAFMVAHHPQWAFARAALAEGRIGRLRHVEGCFTYFNKDADNMRNQVALGGGGLRDVGVYPLVTTRLATACEPARALARLDTDASFGTDAFAEALLDFGDFRLAFTCGTQAAPRQEMTFHGEEGWMRLETPFNPLAWGTARVEIRRGGFAAEGSVRTFPNVDQYRLQAEAFADAVAAVRGGTAPAGVDYAMPLESSLLNQRAIDACFRAADGDGWVEV